jgi:cytoskeletal protein CcmA (bactofilin family)
MVRRRDQATVIADGLKIAGNVEAEGSVELHGEIEGELHCTSLHISEKGRVTGKVVAEDVAVNGSVEGPIYGTDVKLEPKARVTGDIHHESFAMEKGAFFDGRSKQTGRTTKEKPTKNDADSSTNGGSDPAVSKVTKLDRSKTSPAA